jgi:hypothetical protein
MVSQQERARLVEAYKDEPVYVGAVMLKFSVCLLILAGLAVIGAGMDSTRDDAARVQQTRGHENASVTPGRPRLQEPRAHLDARGAAINTSSVNAADPGSRTRNVALDASCGSGC